MEQNGKHIANEQLPPGFRLLPGEQLRSVTYHEAMLPESHISSLEQLLRLTRSHSPEDIGKTGPTLAALALSSRVDTPEHLRLYEALFGRDSLRVAIDLIPIYPQLARTTVLELAKLQGTTYNTSREEEPGRIVHEVRHESDPIARSITKRLGWGWPYYGSVDATPEFIRTLTAYCQISEENRGFLTEAYIDRNGMSRTVSSSLESALEWIEMRLSRNPEGLLEFKSVLPNGIENQAWKDSWDAYHHADGTLANHQQGIASIEVQVTTYDALIDAAELYEDILDEQSYARKLRDEADRLRSAILTHFWVEEKGGYFALGTDRDPSGNLRQLKIRTSNMGHTLNSRLLKGTDPFVSSKRDAVVAQLFSPELLAGSGIRTLASDEVRFRPGAYHNGSVWLWDTHHIAKGLRRLGYHTESTILNQKLLHVAEYTRMLPEYVRGESSKTPSLNTATIVIWDQTYQRENKVEQPPQEVQAWTAAAIRRIKHDDNAMGRPKTW